MKNKSNNQKKQKQKQTPIQYKTPLAKQFKPSQPLQNKSSPRIFIAGFSIIEILIVIAVASITIAISTPNMTSFVRSNRSTGEINQLAAAIRLSKSEAIKRGASVVMCASSSYTDCSNRGHNSLGSGNEWTTGWIIFADPDEDGILNQSSDILRVEQRSGSRSQLSSTAKVTQLRFSREGFAFGLPAIGKVSFTLDSKPLDPRARRCLEINLSGNPLTFKPGDRGCE